MYTIGYNISFVFRHHNLHFLANSRQEETQHLVKDTLQTEVSDVRLDEVKVFVSVVVLLLQRADGVTLRSDK